MKIKSYCELKYTKLVSSLATEFKAIGAKKAVIGLSGGVDSALSAAIAVSALGHNAVSLFYLPYHNDIKSQSAVDVSLTAKALGLKFTTIDIAPIVTSFCNALNVTNPLRKGNIMARSRMISLFDASQKECGIVLGTTNKTEYLLGYGTWYGDMASSINVLGTLYKREVYELASCTDIPESVIAKKPSADLWDGQTDESELGFSYEEADKFFYSVLELDLDYDEVIKLFGKKLCKMIASKVTGSYFKRELPKICGIDEEIELYKEIFNRYIL